MLTEWNEGQTIGVELTWLHPDQERMYARSPNGAESACEYDLISGIACLFRYRAHKKKIPFYKIGTDDHCIEAPTPIAKNWRELEAFYIRANELAKEFDLVPLLNNVSSGGGHVHVGVEDNLWQLAIARDMCNRPYISWAFLDPVDNITARWQGTFLLECGVSLTSRTIKAAKEGKLIRKKDRYYGYYVYENPALWLAPIDKIPVNNLKDLRLGTEVAVRKNCGHLEFRCFAAANNWQEQEEHVAFVLAYVNWIKKELDAKRIAEVQVLKKRDLKAFTYKRCVQEFKELIEKIGLPWERYEHYTTEYLAARFENKEWLV